MIKFRTRNVIEVYDWDKLVIETYGKPYSFQQQEGCKERGTFDFTVPDDETYDEEYNDSIPEEVNGNIMGVKFQVWLDRDPTYMGSFTHSFENDLFWARNFYPDPYTLINDLYKRGLIEAGEYTIDIDWIDW
jgi:hypothetical protein